MSSFRFAAHCPFLKGQFLKGSFLGVLSGGALSFGCASADPMLVGHHETSPVDTSGADSEADGFDGTPGFSDGVRGRPAAAGQAASCLETPFSACGGSVSGTWEVVETCNGENRNQQVLAQWSDWVGLPSEPCTGAARRLTSTWTGEVSFSGKVALDQRDLNLTLDMGVGSKCLTAALEGPGPIMPTDGACAALDETLGVTCGTNWSVCQCSRETVVPADSIGNYSVQGNRIISETDDDGMHQYDYCVQGDYLLYRELGDSRYAIMRRVPEGTQPPR